MGAPPCWWPFENFGWGWRPCRCVWCSLGVEGLRVEVVVVENVVVIAVDVAVAVGAVSTVKLCMNVLHEDEDEAIYTHPGKGGEPRL